MELILYYFIALVLVLGGAKAYNYFSIVKRGCDIVEKNGKRWKVIKGTHFCYYIDESTCFLQLGKFLSNYTVVPTNVDEEILLHYAKPLIPKIKEYVKISNDNNVKDFSKVIGGSLATDLYRLKYIRENYKDFIDFNCLEMTYNEFLKVIDALDVAQEKVEEIYNKLMIERNKKKEEQKRLEKLYESLN